MINNEKIHLEQLGKRLKELRLKAGFTDAEKFAYRAGINREQYRLYELGGNMYLSTLVRLLNALTISAQDFFSEGFD